MKQDWADDLAEAAYSDCWHQDHEWCNICVAKALRSAKHIGAMVVLDSAVKAVEREQSYREYRCDQRGDQDGSGIAACKEVRHYLLALKATYEHQYSQSTADQKIDTDHISNSK